MNFSQDARKKGMQEWLMKSLLVEMKIRSIPERFRSDDCRSHLVWLRLCSVRGCKTKLLPARKMLRKHN